jgi:hypothetical protein
MPRFGADSIRNAIKEQLFRELAKDGMMDKEPMSGIANPLGRQQFGEFVPRPRGEMQYGSINEFVQNERPRKYDDTQTEQQRRSTNIDTMDKMDKSQIYMMRPHQYNDPISQELQFPPPAALGWSSGNAMRDAYMNLPEQGPPKYPMQVMPAPSYDEQFQSQQGGGAMMDQLLQFYSNEGI